MAKTSANTPIVVPTKAKPGRQSTPPGRKVDSGQDIARDTRLRYLEQVDTYLNANRITDAVRMACRQMGTVGTAHFNLIETAMTEWKVTAYSDDTNQIDPEGQKLINAVLSRMDNILDYSIGYDDKAGLHRVVEQLLNDVATTGGLGVELVLDDQRLPERLVPFPYDSVTWRQGSKSRFPVQRGTGEEVELNHPTVAVADFHRSVNEVYAYPMFEAALKEGRAYEQFVESMRKVLQMAGHARLHVSLDYMRIKDAAPPETQSDPEALKAWMAEVRADVEAIINDLKPEEALVTFDVATVTPLETSEEKSEYVSLLNALSGNLATALKSNPSILGLRLEGSQSLSNTESLIFLKVAHAIRRPVEEALSRLLTLACRLFGATVYTKFVFDPIELRPGTELAAFKIMEQDRDMKFLSMGVITDDEFSVRQGLSGLPDGYKPLSGTMFYDAKSVDASKASPNDGAQERALQPKTPSKSGGASQ